MKREHEGEDDEVSPAERAVRLSCAGEEEREAGEPEGEQDGVEHQDLSGEEFGGGHDVVLDLLGAGEEFEQREAGADLPDEVRERLFTRLNLDDYLNLKIK
jgi:hypothetical protein